MRSVSIKLQGVELSYFSGEVLECYTKVDNAISGKALVVSEVELVVYQYYFTELRLKLHKVAECVRLNRELSLPVKPGYLVVLKKFFLSQDSVLANIIVGKLDKALVDQLKISQ